MGQNQEQQTGIIPHTDNPFKDDITKFIKTEKEYYRTAKMQGRGITSEEITVTYRKTYYPFGFTKLYQNKEMMEDLSPWACKILIHIALNMGYEDQTIKLTYSEVGMNIRSFGKAMTELMLARVLYKHKNRATYWVNITILVTGRINKEQFNSDYNPDG